MSKAGFFKDRESFFSRFFSKKEENYIYKFLYSFKCAILKRYNSLKLILNKIKETWDFKKAGEDAALFLANALLEGSAINFITLILFQDYLSIGKFLAYGLVPQLIIYYVGKLKNGDNTKLYEKKPGG